MIYAQLTIREDALMGILARGVRHLTFRGDLSLPLHAAHREEVANKRAQQFAMRNADIREGSGYNRPTKVGGTSWHPTLARLRNYYGNGGPGTDT